MLDTMARFARAHRIADVDRAVLLGHSFGTIVSAVALTRRCGTDSRSELVCDGATGPVPYRAMVLAFVEGALQFNLSLPAGTMLLFDALSFRKRIHRQY